MGTAPELDLFDDVGFLLSRGSGLVVRMTNASLRRTGLRVRHFSVLSIACDTEGVSQRDLSDMLGLDPSQIVALVDELQKQGLVERQPDPRDRRTRIVSPTRRGRSVNKRARGRVASAREEFLSPLDPGEREALLTMLRKVALQDLVDQSVVIDDAGTEVAM